MDCPSIKHTDICPAGRMAGIRKAQPTVEALMSAIDAVRRLAEAGCPIAIAYLIKWNML